MTKRMALGDKLPQKVKSTLVNGKMISLTDKVFTLGLTEGYTKEALKMAKSTDKVFTLGLAEKGTSLPEKGTKEAMKTTR